MWRPPLRYTVTALGLCAAAGALAVGAFAALGSSSAPAAAKHPAAVKPATTPKVTVINVSLGKPSELAFKLSKTSMIPAGTVTFKVTNLGMAYHDFKLCAKPLSSATSATNVCAGKKTAVLKPKQTATLTLVLSKTGKYEFLCSVTGHAVAGMKGLLGIGVAVTAAEQKLVSKAGADAGGSGGSGGSGSTGGSGSGGSSGGGANLAEEIGPAVGCPPGVTVKAAGGADGDGDELGTEKDDQDGCV
jgi:uncharacterized cupredoxin-like copper-binding protein